MGQFNKIQTNTLSRHYFLLEATILFFSEMPSLHFCAFLHFRAMVIVDIFSQTFLKRTSAGQKTNLQWIQDGGKWTELSGFLSKGGVGRYETLYVCSCSLNKRLRISKFYEIFPYQMTRRSFVSKDFFWFHHSSISYTPRLASRTVYPIGGVKVVIFKKFWWPIVVKYNNTYSLCRCVVTCCGDFNVNRDQVTSLYLDIGRKVSISKTAALFTLLVW